MRLLSIVAVFLLAASVATSTQADAGDLKGNFLLDTGIYPCGGWPAAAQKEFTAPHDMRIVAVDIFAGMTFGGRGDMDARVIRTSSNDVLCGYQQDRYGPPDGVSQKRCEFQPNWFLVKKGEKLKLRAMCSAAPGDKGIKGHHFAHITWIKP